MFKLRDYQQEVVDAFDGAPNLSLAVSPTSSGKTVIMHAIALQHDATIICPSFEIVEQFKEFYPKVFTYNYAYIHNISGDVLLIDEAHRVKKDGMVETVMKNFKTVYGLTATDYRTDIGEIYPSVFKHKVIEITKERLIEAGYLTPRKYAEIPVECLINVKASTLYKSKQLSDEVCPQTNKCLNHFFDNWDGKKTIYFGCDITHCEKIQLDLKLRGITSEIVMGDLDKGYRKKLVDDFRDGDLHHLINCKVLTEGFNAPAISNVVILRPTCSKSLYEQMCGRGDRLHEGKTNNNIYDYTYSKFNVVGRAPGKRERFCLDCGSVNVGNKPNCTECGVKMFKYDPDLKKCVHCGFENFVRARYCGDCGKNISKKYKLTDEFYHVGINRCKGLSEIIVGNKVIKTVSSGAANRFIDKLSGHMIEGNAFTEIYEVKPFKMLMNGRTIEKIIPVK